MTKIMTICRRVASALRILYPDCKRVLIANGTHDERHSHFHLIPLIDDDCPFIPRYSG